MTASTLELPAAEPAVSPETAPIIKKVGVLLGIGIVALPGVFAWFTLRKGYSAKARTLTFAWAFLWGLAYSSGSHTAAHKEVTQPVAEQQVAPQSEPAGQFRPRNTGEWMVAMMVRWQEIGGNCGVMASDIMQLVQSGRTDWAIQRFMQVEPVCTKFVEANGGY